MMRDTRMQMKIEDIMVGTGKAAMTATMMILHGLRGRVVVCTS